MQRISVVEDDPETGQLYMLTLKMGGFAASLYPTPGGFFDSLLKGHPDLIIMDINLPGMDGKEVIRVLRGNPQTSRIPIIAVSGRMRQTQDVINGLHVGADEYLVKPVNSDLLLARIGTLLRRPEALPPAQPAIKVGAMTILPDERSVRVSGEEVKLTRLEYDLLQYMLQNSNRVLTRGLILDSVWRGDGAVNSRTVDKHVEALRKKLKPVKDRVSTVVGVGYILKL
ncbi:MAG: response regulator transcription factor [Elusimicrobia bacterium]|nr:response regulator transcription factor [Elusimicrobiota bacterium]